MTLFCPVTGLKVFTTPDWINQKVSKTFEANFWIIGDSIIYSLPKGFTDLNGVQNSLALNDKVAEFVSGGREPYVQIEDYSLLKGTSFEARRYFTSNINSNNRRLSIVFCNATLPLSIAIKIGKRFNTTKKYIHIAKYYRDAIKQALKLDMHDTPTVNPNSLDICNCFDNKDCSLSPVELFSENSWQIQTPGYSNRSIVVDRCILHSSSEGHLEVEHIPFIEQMRKQCQSDISDNSTIKYIVVDVGKLSGGSRTARARYMQNLKNWYQRFPFRMYIVYNANTFMKTALYLAKPLMPFKVKIANDIKHAFQMIHDDRCKKPLEQPAIKKDSMPATISQKDIKKLFGLISSLNWQAEGIDNSFDIDEGHPFYFLFQAIHLIKEEIDDLLIERSRTVDALRESQRKYKQLFDHAPAGMFEIDLKEFKITNVNEVMCVYSGYSEAEFLSMNPLDLLTKRSRKLLMERFENLSMGKKTSNTVEYSVVKKDGDKLNVLLNNDYIYDDEKLIGARVVIHDITEFKQAEEDKIKAQKIAGEQKKLALVGQVAGKMAHDFNNILGIIMGNTELSLMDCKDAEMRKTLELIFEQTIRGKNLTRNLVAFAKDQEPNQEFFKINEKIDLVLSLMKRDLDGISIIKEDESNVPDLLADPGMIEHTLVNLIQNSIHATSMLAHPRITMRTYRLDDNICFEIEDNGCGIFKNHLEKIYEPSFTMKGGNDVTNSYKIGIKGTGYGMSNVKKYIELHKGSISVESESGSGTKFTISLPVIRKELTNKEKAEIKEEKICFDKSILLVEDEPAISGVEYRLLSQEPCNHRVDIANDGQVALDLFERNNYDLVSLDYILPGKINGMDVYDYIRKTNKTIPILFVSGNIEFLESIKDLKNKDTNIDHLSKPCQNKEYVSSINKLLKKL